MGDFNWLTTDELEEFEVSIIGNDSDYGFIRELNIDYPDHLHNSHNE